MNLCDFLHFNTRCPICNNPLTLYMQWLDSICFKATKTNEYTYRFDPFKCIKDKELENEYMILEDHGTDFITNMSSNKLFNECKKYQVYFFFLCNSDGFKDSGFYKNSDDYQIVPYKGCYFRFNPYMELRKKDFPSVNPVCTKWVLETTQEDNISLINYAENICIKSLVGDMEKVYTLSLNYGDKTTTLWYYSITEEQIKEENYSPRIFEKELPLLGNRPNFDLEHREQLIDRFNSWIIMS